ncbi:putative quinol monooxygenase [Paraherbaspirillum soli]|uniref:Quinol monooxygenase n=1 Tax=Paraherbaspirillum soli TaxID=631222 RepID=A0ABW0MDT2_9BURK
MVKIMARISSRADTSTLLKNILQELVVPSRNEAGCLGYELYQDDDNPLDFVTVELWMDQAAAEAHLASPHVMAALTKADDLLAQLPEIRRYTRLA